MIFHVDVNSAFLSWSAVKRLSEDPRSTDLRTVPAVVAGDPSTRHGIVTAKSIPAKKAGIHTAEPLAQALKKCPGLIVVPSDFTTYRAYSDAFLKILKRYTLLVEKASIDEAYMDVTDLEKKYRSLETEELPFPLCLAQQIRGQIREELGFTVNIGISVNKLLAKMASDFEKPDRTHTLYPEEIPVKMWPLPLRKLFGCGERTAQRLERMGFHTIGDAAKAPEDYLKSFLGEKSGEYIWRSANGMGSDIVRPVREEARSCSNEVTTPQDITAANYEQEMPPLLKKLCGKVAGRLQKDGFYAGTVSVMVKTSDFRRRSIQTKMADPDNREEILYQYATKLSKELLFGGDRNGILYQCDGIRLVGVGTSDLSHGEYRQLSFSDLIRAEASLAVDSYSEPAAGSHSEPVGNSHPEQIADRYPAPDAGSYPSKNAGETPPPDMREKASSTGNTDQAPNGMNSEKMQEAETRRKKKSEALSEMTRKIREKYGEDAVRKGI